MNAPKAPKAPKALKTPRTRTAPRRTAGPRRALLLLVGLALSLGMVPAVSGPASAEQPSAASSAQPTRHHRTTLTLTSSCEGCTISLVNAQRAHVHKVWSSRSRSFVDGRATFTIPTRFTRGLSAAITAPWERRLGYVTEVVFGYEGLQQGQTPGFRAVRRQRVAYGCWDGTSAASITVPLVIRPVRVQGIGGRTTGTVAYARQMQPVRNPSTRVVGGVLGQQDVLFCGASGPR